MKASMNENPIIAEIDMLKRNSIQGLYNSKNAIKSFWSLKAKIELSVFREHKNGEMKHERR
jgi:hypothetical protein